MLIHITERRRKIIEFLEAFEAENHYPPTIREIGQAVGISSTSVVAYNLDRLIEAGLIKRLDRSGRSLVGINQADLAPASRILSTRSAHHRIRGRRPKATVNTSDALTYFGGCAYCGSTADLIQRDHFVPIARGGTESVNNLIPSCYACNQAKSDKEPVAWVLSKFGPVILAKVVHYLCTVVSNT